jgi:hypothetical protein
LNHITAPKGFVPAKMENLADDPLREGVAIPSVMEKTAAGAPAQERTQVCQPVSFCIFAMIWALLGAPDPGVGLGLGLAPGLGEGVGPGLEEALVAVEPEALVCPPHPANAAQTAKVKTTRLGRSSFFSSFILGNSLRVASFRRVTFCGVYRDPE